MQISTGYHRAFAMWLLCLYAFCAPALTEEIVIGVEMIDYKPYYYLENNEYEGFARELFDGFAKSKGHSVTYRPLPINRLYQEFRTGKIDFKFPDNPNWGSDDKRGLSVSYSNSVVGFTDGVLTRSQYDCDVRPLMSLGYVRGFTPWPYLNQIDEKTLKAVEVNSLASLLKMVNAGRVDAAFVNVSVARSMMSDMEMPEDSLVFSNTCPHDASNYLLSTHKKPHLLTEFNQYLTEEFLAQLYAKYQLEVNE